MTDTPKYAILALSLAAAISMGSDAASQPASGEIWAIYPMENGTSMLSYGTPETDNIAISFSCRRREGAVSVFSPVQTAPSPEPAMNAHWNTTLSLRSGSVRRSYPVRAQMTELGPMIDGLRIALSDPLIVALRTNFTMGDARGQWPASSPAQRRAITRFFAGCARAR